MPDLTAVRPSAAIYAPDAGCSTTPMSVSQELSGVTNNAARMSAGFRGADVLYTATDVLRDLREKTVTHFMPGVERNVLQKIAENNTPDGKYQVKLARNVYMLSKMEGVQQDENYVKAASLVQDMLKDSVNRLAHREDNIAGVRKNRSEKESSDRYTRGKDIEKLISIIWEDWPGSDRAAENNLHGMYLRDGFPRALEQQHAVELSQEGAEQVALEGNGRDRVKQTRIKLSSLELPDENRSDMFARRIEAVIDRLDDKMVEATTPRSASRKGGEKGRPDNVAGASRRFEQGANYASNRGDVTVNVDNRGILDGFSQGIAGLFQELQGLRQENFTLKQELAAVRNPDRAGAPRHDRREIHVDTVERVVPGGDAQAPSVERLDLEAPVLQWPTQEFGQVSGISFPDFDESDSDSGVEDENPAPPPMPAVPLWAAVGLDRIDENVRNNLPSLMAELREEVPRRKAKRDAALAVRDVPVDTNQMEPPVNQRRDSLQPNASFASSRDLLFRPFPDAIDSRRNSFGSAVQSFEGFALNRESQLPEVIRAVDTTLHQAANDRVGDDFSQRSRLPRNEVRSSNPITAQALLSARAALKPIPGDGAAVAVLAQATMTDEQALDTDLENMDRSFAPDYTQIVTSAGTEIDGARNLQRSSSLDEVARLPNMKPITTTKAKVWDKVVPAKFYGSPGSGTNETGKTWQV